MRSLRKNLMGVIFSRTTISNPKSIRSRRVKRMWNIYFDTVKVQTFSQLSDLNSKVQLFRTDMLDKTVDHHQNIEWGNISWRNIVYPPREAVLAAQHLRMSLIVGSSFNLSLICFSYGVNPPHGGNITNISALNL